MYNNIISIFTFKHLCIFKYLYKNEYKNIIIHYYITYNDIKKK
jgi:hypothetical protein